MNRKINELTLRQIINICESSDCGNCPLVKRQDNIVIKLCLLKIEDIKDVEVLL